MLVILTAGPVIARENSASSSMTAVTAEPGSNLDYGNNQIAERAIDERIIDRIASLEPSDGSRSSRYSISFDIEHEDSDWSFDVAVTMEF
jgi:hypothetical protein